MTISSYMVNGMFYGSPTETFGRLVRIGTRLKIHIEWAWVLIDDIAGYGNVDAQHAWLGIW